MQEKRARRPPPQISPYALIVPETNPQKAFIPYMHTIFHRGSSQSAPQGHSQWRLRSAAAAAAGLPSPPARTPGKAAAAGSTAAPRLSEVPRRAYAFSNSNPKKLYVQNFQSQSSMCVPPVKVYRTAKKYPPLHHDFLCDTILRKAARHGGFLLPFNSNIPVFRPVCPLISCCRIFGFYKRRPSHG